jgi:hypothetical protein
MNGNDCLQPGLCVPAKDDALVIVKCGVFESGHVIP